MHLPYQMYFGRRLASGVVIETEACASGYGLLRSAWDVARHDPISRLVKYELGRDAREPERTYSG